MEVRVRLANIVPRLLLLLINSLFGDVEKFVSKVRFHLRTFSKIFCACNEQKLLISPCKTPTWDVQVQEGGISIEEVNTMGIVCFSEGNYDNSSVTAQDMVALFEEEEPSFDEIKETFRIFDANNDGFIDATDLHAIITKLGLKERYCLEECKKMIKAAFDNSNGDGLIDFQDFVKFMEKCLC